MNQVIRLAAVKWLPRPGQGVNGSQPSSDKTCPRPGGNCKNMLSESRGSTKRSQCTIKKPNSGRQAFQHQGFAHFLTAYCSIAPLMIWLIRTTLGRPSVCRFIPVSCLSQLLQLSECTWGSNIMSKSVHFSSPNYWFMRAAARCVIR